MQVASRSLVLACLLCSVAQASPEQADAEFERGRALLRFGDYAGACAAFEHSQALDAQFGTLYNLANCYAKRGMTASAWKVYRELEQHDTNAKRRDDAALRARELEAKLSKLRVTAPSPGWRVTLNGVDVSALVDTDTPVDPGVYEVVATAPGQPRFHATARLGDGEAVTVAIRTRGEAPDVVDPFNGNISAGPHPVLDAHPLPPDPAYMRRRTYAITAIVGGGAIMLVGLALANNAHGTWDDVHELCPPSTGCPDEFTQQTRDELAGRAHGRTVGAVTLLLIGGGAVGGGIYLYKTNKRSDAATVRVAPAAGGIVLSGRF